MVRTLRPHLVGQTVLAVEGRALPLAGKTVREVRRHGKFILIEFDDGLLAVHLRMTGKLLWNGAVTPYTRVRFHCDGGELLFDDIRKFGTLEWRATPPERGPDAMAISEAEFVARLRGRKGRIKPLLLDQRFLQGIGNIYADEMLFAARIHPKAKSLGPSRVRALYRAMRAVLEEAIAAGGSSISDYVDAAGRGGSFQDRHQVYGRAGEPCARCGTAVRRIVLGQRGTHYCPRCQRH